MKGTKRTSVFYEIEHPKEFHGLAGRFKDVDAALESINYSYQLAKKRGYENKHERWAIVCVKKAKLLYESGEFFKETMTRTRVAVAEFDESVGEYRLA